MIKTRLALLPIVVLFLVAGCEKNPANRFVNPAPAQNPTGTYSGQWIIYDDELKTGGTVMFLTSSDGQQFNLSCYDNPHSGTKCIEYSWDGRNVTAYGGTADSISSSSSIENTWCGFSFIAANSIASYNSVTKNLALGGYTKMTFWARGTLNSNVSLRLESNNGGPNSVSGSDAIETGTLSSSWQYYEFSVTPAAAAKDFVRVILKFNQSANLDAPNGNGGTVFLDDIILTK
jgi:hypothetical protein